MSLESFLSLATGAIGFAFFGIVLSGYHPLPTESRRLRIFQVFGFILMFGSFLGQSILRASQMPRWVLIISALGLALGMVASLFGLRTPPRKSEEEPHA